MGHNGSTLVKRRDFPSTAAWRHKDAQGTRRCTVFVFCFQKTKDVPSGWSEYEMSSAGNFMKFLCAWFAQNNSSTNHGEVETSLIVTTRLKYLDSKYAQFAHQIIQENF